MAPAVAIASLPSTLFNWPWALEPIAERVMLLTPVDVAQQLLLRLGPIARPLALLGGFAVCLAIGGLGGLIALPPRGAPAVRGGIWLVFRFLLAGAFLYGVLFLIFPPLAFAPTAILGAAYLSLLALPVMRGAERTEVRAGPDMSLPGLKSGVSRSSLSGPTHSPRVPTAVGRGGKSSDEIVPRRAKARASRANEAPRPEGRGFHSRPAAQTRRQVEGSPRRGFLLDSARILGATGLLTALLLIDPWYKALTVYRHGGRLFAFRPPGPRRSGFALAGLTPEVTPPGQFYYLSKNLIDPDLTAEEWMLRIDGLVECPFMLSFSTLRALPARTQWVTQECVSNPVGGPLIGCALFTGVSLRLLLAQAGPLPQAATVVMRAPDGHADSIPLQAAMNANVLLAYGMDGAYLERGHGYPVRMLIPGSYGFKSIKWVEHIELVAHEFKGTWQELGWTASATVHTTARIDVAERTPAGALVAGVAFAGARGIRAVQVRADGGPWIATELHAPPLSPLTWVQWRVVLPIRGHVALEARAIDGTGAVQEERRSDIYPAGATGYYRVSADL